MVEPRIIQRFGGLLENSDISAEGDIFAFPHPAQPKSFESIVKAWSTKETLYWMGGVDNGVYEFTSCLDEHGIDGQKLLLLDEDSLFKMGVKSFGVVKMVMQAVELLNTFCYDIGKVNLQSLCLNVCVCADDMGYAMERIQSDIRSVAFSSRSIAAANLVLSAVGRLIEHLKKVLVWLDRSPFDRVPVFINFRSTLMSECLSLIRTVCDPTKHLLSSAIIQCICKISRSVNKMCNSIVTSSLDPLVLYTTYLETAVLRKTSDFTTWGFGLQSSYRGVHVVSDVKLDGPADISGKVDAGDELLQMNGETVVGWDSRKVIQKLTWFASSGCCRELILLLNKRPTEPTLVRRIVPAGFRTEQSKRILQKQPLAVHPLIAEEGGSANESLLADYKSTDVSPEIIGPRANAGITSTHMYNQIPLIRRATISGSTPPLVLASHRTIKHSRSLTFQTREGGEADVQLEMVIRRRRTMRQQPGGYVRSFIDNQSVCALEDCVSYEAERSKALPKGNDEEETESATTSLYISKSPLPPDETEDDMEPKNYAVIDVVDQCDLDLLESPPVDGIEWSASVKLPLHPVEDEPQKSERSDRGSTSVLSDVISIQDYSESPTPQKSQPEPSYQIPSSVYGLQKMRPFITIRQAPIAETDETSLGWESDAESDANSFLASCCENTASSSLEPISPFPETSSSNILRDLSCIPCVKLEEKQQYGWVRRKRLDHERVASKWIKCWMVLRFGVLYIYQHQFASSADIVIAVTNFMVSDAPELKTSKKHVFRLHRNSSAFYFSTTKVDEMKTWMNNLGLASIGYNQTVEERERSNVLSRSMVFIASLDDSLRSPVFSMSPSPPLHHTLPRANVSSTSRRTIHVPRQNSLRSPRSSDSVDSVSPLTFFAGRFFRRKESLEK